MTIVGGSASGKRYITEKWKNGGNYGQCLTELEVGGRIIQKHIK